MNQQREVIYDRRRKALEGERLKDSVLDQLYEFINDLVEDNYENAEIDIIKEEMLKNLLVDITVDPKTFADLGKEGLRDKLFEAAKTFYQRKEEMLGSELMGKLERFAVLSVIDEKWKEHLREMDDMKEGIGLRAYGQKDPLIEYKQEGYRLFVTMLNEIRNNILSFCFKFFPQAPEEMQRRNRPVQRMQTIKDEVTGLGSQGGHPEGTERGKQQPVKVEDKIGRNDPCPCGSGKKYKQCCGS